MLSTRFFSIFALLIGAAGLSLALIALGTTRWRYSILTREEFGLFEKCLFSADTNCQVGAPELDFSYVRATIAFMIMGSFFNLVAVLVSTMMSCGKGGEKTHLIATILFLVSGIFLMVACAVYTGVGRSSDAETNLGLTERFGYSLWIGWGSCIVTLLAVPFAMLAKSHGLYA